MLYVYRRSLIDRLVRFFMTNNLWRNLRKIAGWPIHCVVVLGLCSLILGLGVQSTYAQPANDAWAAAVQLSGASGSTNGSTAGATVQAGERRYTSVGSSSVWYKWTAPVAGLVTFEINVSSGDAVVTAYAGTALNNLATRPASNEPVGNVVTFNAVSGTEYFVAVTGGANPAFGGDFILKWNVEQEATTNRFAGTFRFSSVTYSVGEFDSSSAPFGPPTPAIPFRGVDGAVVTVTREGGSAGRVAVNYRTMDEIAAGFALTEIWDITSVTNSPTTYTNSATVTQFITNAFLFVSNVTSVTFSTNWGTTVSACADDETSCMITNRISGCSAISTARVTPRVGCPDSDYVSTPGILIFDEFETVKKFVVPVFSDAFADFPRVSNGIKPVRLELFNQRLVDEEVSNPTGILPPLRNQSGSSTTLNIVESYPRNGGTNFFIERTTYAVDEDAGSVNVDIIHPSGSGGSVIVHVVGSEGETLPWAPIGGSDYASSRANNYNEPEFTDGTTGFTGAQDFTASDNTLAFAANQTRIRINIPLFNDTEVEFNEDIHVWLEGIPNNPPVLGNRTANITILFDDQPAGALDREWNPDDVSTTEPRFNPTPGANNIVRAVAVQSDDKTVIGGDFTAYNSFSRNHLARINTDGSHDETFNPGTGADDFVTSLVIYSTGAGLNAGKILVGGGFTSMNNIQRNGIARLNANGSLDESFNPGTGANGAVRSIALQSDGKVLIAGEFTQVNGVERNNLARLNSDGSLDTSFNPGSGADGILWSVAVVESPARKIYIGGEFMEFNGIFRGNVARLNENGSLDTAFEPGGGADGPVYTLSVMADGRLLVGGYFSSFDFTSRGSIARLLTTGALDTSFRPGTGANDAVYSIALQPDQKIFVGGVFTSYNGTRRMGLTRLFVNGTVDTSFLDTAYNHFAGLVNSFGFEAPNYVNSVALQSDGAVMIGGSFHQVGGNAAAEINDNGSAYLVGNVSWAWTRADKRPRYNVARLIGGYTPGPGNVGYVLNQNTVDENSPTLTVPLRRYDGRLGTVGATAGTSNNLAISGTDFFGFNGQPTWVEDARPNEPISVGTVGEQFYTISISDDSTIEGDELFGLSLADPVGSIRLGGGTQGTDIIPLGAALALPEAVGTITDNDFNKGILAFNSLTYYTNENVSSMRVTVIRTNGSSGPISVRYYTYNGSALNGSDYTGTTLGTLSFGSGEITKIINIPLINDNLVEADETFYIVLTNATGGATIYGSTASATNSVTAQAVIIDNDLNSGRISFVGSNFSAGEASGTALITLQRLGGSAGQIQASVGAFAGTAANTIDFTGVTNTVVWVNGDVASKTVAVPLLDDSAVEGNENVILRVLSTFPAGLTGLVDQATLTILDDDNFGTLAFSQPYFDGDERGTNVTITVVRSGGIGGTVSADFSLTPGTALAGTDYINTSGTLTFAAGVMATNFEVIVLDNALTTTNGYLDASLILGNYRTNGVVHTAGTVSMSTLRIYDDEFFGDPAGSLDTSFSPLAGSSNAIYSILLQPDGKLLVGGEFRTLNRSVRNRVGRLNTNGTLDATFSPRSGPNNTVRSMALQSDGRLVIGGFFTSVHSTNRNRIARLLSDGAVDSFFNPGAGADNPVYAVAICPDGRIAVGGAFTTMNGISRSGIVLLENNGTVSTTFDPGSGVVGTVFAVAVQPDGKILIGGDFETVDGASRPRLARLNADGSLDVSFDAGIGPDGPVRAIVLQPDGKVLIGGSFTSVNGTARGRLARLNSGGALDTAFMSAVDGADGDVNAIALQYDNKVVVAGEFSTFNGVSRRGLTRLNRNGKTDPTINFGQGADDAINTVAVQPDRKLVIGGRFSSYDGQPRAFLARLHGGSIAGAGALEFTTPFYEISENGVQATITVQRRGGTTGDVTVDYATVPDTATAGVDYASVTGTLTFLEAETIQTFTVPILDDSVGEDTEVVGLVLSNATGGAGLGAVPNAYLGILSDDSGVGFASSTYSVNEGIAGGAALITVTRTGTTNSTVVVGYRSSNGTAIAGQDYTSQAGLLTFGPGVAVQTFSMAISDDSLIEPAETFTLTLTNSSGNAALAITSTTVTIVDNDYRAGDLAFSASSYSVAESGGSVAVSVIRTNGSTGVLSVDYRTVAGLATEGSDYLGRSGTLIFTEGQTNQTITITIQDDGTVEGDENFFVQLLNPASGTVISGVTNVMVTIVDEEFGLGSVDRSFDPGDGASGLVRSVHVATNGSVLVSGSFTSFDGFPRNYVTRLNADGSTDTNFVIGTGPNALVSSVAPVSGNGVMIAGAFSSVNGTNRNRVARLTSGGALDFNFSDAAGLNAAVYTMLIQPDGRVLLGGAFSQPTRGISRLQVSGQIDSTFGAGNGVDGAVHAIAVQADGGVIIGGTFSTLDSEAHSRVARLNSAGVVDSTFLSGAISTGTVFCAAIQSDGKILLGGDFATSDATNRVNLARLNTDGSLDGSFSVGTGANSIVYTMGLQSDGHILIGGDFTSVNGVNRNRFARLNSDGSLDTAFDPGTGANNTVYSLKVLPDDNLLLGGDFTVVGGVTRPGVARVVAASVAPSAISAVLAAGGTFTLSLSVAPGRTYVLEASANLKDWAPVVTNQATSSSWQFNQSNPQTYKMRFYRMREVR